jgi:hypothetical protein
VLKEMTEGFCSICFKLIKNLRAHTFDKGDSRSLSEDVEKEEEKKPIAKDAIEAAHNIGELMLDTLKEHGRDYDNSKAEIVDFFLALAGGRQKINCPYREGDRIEYLSWHRKKWIPGTVLYLRGAAEWNHWTPDEIHLQLDIKSEDSSRFQSRSFNHIHRQ